MKYVVGNWKMNLGIRESVALARGVLRALRGKEETPNIILCPSYTALGEVRKVLARSRVELGAQNCGPALSGAMTGEIGLPMLEDFGCSHVLIGHSERRAFFGETEAMIHEKISLFQQAKAMPILCVGESHEIRESGKALEFIAGQIDSAYEGVDVSQKKPVMIAYEPVWAIGTGEAATVGDVIEVHQFIRDRVSQLLQIEPEDVVILYGGSVDAENAYQYLREVEINGLLIGGASLKLQQFTAILESATEVILAQK